jgi:hypothetical protein
VVSTGNVSPRLSTGILFSDGVIREHGTGKLTLIGCFQFFNAPAFPFVSPPFFVSAFIEYLPLGEEVTARVSLQTAEGAQLAFAIGQLKLDNVLDPSAQFELPFQLPPTNFQTPGNYVVRVFVADQEIGKRTLFVRSITQTQFRNN